ncbi:MAG: hypothetical protein GTO30_21335 [Acidobacteria bacterium]|nr:hypothetical protein [Acidobacteriota bacterium]NIQ85361.1 hypothetical protein [Acidobacteriota bacterium]
MATLLCLAEVADGCEGLFGRPNEITGLDDSRCSARCECEDGVFEPPDYTEEDIRELNGWVLLDPPAELIADPYAAPAGQAPLDEKVCAVVPESPEARTYRLESFDSEQAVREAGGWITHTGACGVCSSLADLAVYMRESDLATPVRRCALKNFFGSMESHLACLEAIGFQRPCAQIWYYNTRHTRQECSRPCLAGLGATYHDDDGALNECIRCDEDRSGPVFKAVSGRTRRNSGLPSALCRPCDTVSRIVHRYPPTPEESP